MSSLRIGIIGGTGIEDQLVASGLLVGMRHVSIETPFGAPSAPIALGRLSGSDVDVAILRRHGEGHRVPPHRVPYRANIFALKSLGTTHVVATGAVGSLREEIAPGSLVLVDQFIDRTTGAGGRGEHRTFFDDVAVHVEFAEPTCPVMRRWLRHAATHAPLVDAVRASGTYVCIDGPSFSTRAESLAHRQAGADLVGMTALPEARLAREAEMAYALIALPTDYDCWRDRPDACGESTATGDSLLAEIIGNVRQSAAAALRLIEAALGDPAILSSEASPSHDALRLAIWTPRDLIPSEIVERLRPIWGRHFGASTASKVSAGS